MSIFPYIAHLCCKKAAELLRESAASVQEISSYVGYEDSNYFVKVFKKQYHSPSHFSKAFKKVLGISPLQYRITDPVLPF